MEDKYDLDIAIQKALEPISDNWVFEMKLVECVNGEERTFERSFRKENGSSFKNHWLPLAIIAYSSKGALESHENIPLLRIARVGRIVPAETIDILEFRIYYGNYELDISKLGMAGKEAVHGYLKRRGCTNDLIEYVLSNLSIDDGEKTQAHQP